MENQSKKNIVLDAWQLWCGLPTEQRQQMSSRLGAVGHLLNIATNVQKIVGPIQAQSAAAPQSPQAASTNEDDDIIDVEWEETK